MQDRWICWLLLRLLLSGTLASGFGSLVSVDKMWTHISSLPIFEMQRFYYYVCARIGPVPVVCSWSPWSKDKVSSREKGIRSRA